MPNDVYSSLTLHGPQEEIDRFVQSITAQTDAPQTDEEREAGVSPTTYEFEKLLPMPEELRGARSPVQIVSQEDYDRALKNQSKLDKDLGVGLPITEEMQRKYMAKEKTYRVSITIHSTGSFSIKGIYKKTQRLEIWELLSKSFAEFILSCIPDD